MIKRKIISLSVLILLTLFVFDLNVFSDEIDNNNSDLLEFSASIKYSDITDGTAPFDSTNESGYDSNAKNGIVRTFDNVTYPLKITINPKKADSLKNIKLRITGEIKKGISDDRVNAVFSNGNTIDMVNSKVTFEQFYTIKETGNSVMIPIVVETRGAIDGTEIKPVIKVEVISVDGKNLEKDKIQATFNVLPTVKITGKVNFTAKFGTTYGVNNFMEKGINPNVKDKDYSLVHARGIAFYATPLAGKTSMVGATFPEGDINYHFEITGRVDWDSGETEYLNFENKNEPFEMFGIYPISLVTKFEGSKNTVSESLSSFIFDGGRRNQSSRSTITNTTNATTLQNESVYSVWDSGKYEVSKKKIDKNKIIIEGTNKDFVIGSTFPSIRADGAKDVIAFAQNEYAFSTQGFLWKSPNEYLPLYKNNVKNKPNNVFYTLKIVIDNYVNKHGEKIPVNKAIATTINERNNPAGSFSVQGAFRSYPDDKELGTPVVGNSAVSKGDATIIMGQDAQYYNYLHVNMYTLGGYKQLYKWNTDSFELTKDYADRTEAYFYSAGYLDPYGVYVKRDEQRQKVFFGISKNESNTFKSLTENNHWDYEWYDTFEEAKSKGVVSAILNDVYAETGPGTQSAKRIYLKVKTKEIGSYNLKGTPNIVTKQAYVYPDAERSKEYIVRTGGYKNPSEYDDLGNLITMQSPVGSTINFETLAIINAQLSTSVTSDKNTYYSTDKVKWTVKSSLLVPESVSLNNNEKVEIKQILPKGLLYSTDSGKIGNIPQEPVVKSMDNGQTELIWNYYLSQKQKTIPDLIYETTIDPLNLPEGIETALEVKSIISNPLDTRPEKFRLATRTIKNVKIGMVGIGEKLKQVDGDRNSEYELQLTPYTTIDDEANVKGVTVLPYDGDRYGSSFHGESRLKAINLDSQKDVEIWVNNQIVLEKNPNNIDLTKNGWKKINIENTADLTNVKTVLFFVKGILTKQDKVSINLVMQTKDNKFNDVYVNSTSINSGTNYQLSPESNKVKFSIRADVELKMRKLQIFTNKYDVGLDGNLELNKAIVNQDSVSEPISISIYDTSSKQKVFTKNYTAANLPEKINFKIPKDYLKKNHDVMYEAVFESFNDNKVFAVDNYTKIDTKGYTSSEQSITNSTNLTKGIDYKGVIMTERVVGQEMDIYYEELTVSPVSFKKVKSGYGVDFDEKYKIIYTNELKKRFDIDTRLILDNELVEKTLSVKNVDNKKSISLEVKSETVSPDLTNYQFNYQFPNVLVKQGNGAVYFEKDNEAIGENRSLMIEGGNKLYIPIWIDKLGDYNMSFDSSMPVGVNAVSFKLQSKINIYAYMYATMDSKTKDYDELMFSPVFPDSDTPFGWTNNEIAWLKGK